MQWYEELDFDANPFLDETTRLIGYEGIVNEVLYNIDAGNIIFIEGGEGSGKTAILQKAIQQFRGEGKVAYIDCSLVQDLNIERVIEKRNGLLGALFNKKPHGMIILVDNITTLSTKNAERIKYFYDQNYVKSVVFTGKSMKDVKFTPSLIDRVKKVITLPEIKDDQASLILKEKLKGLDYFDEPAAKELYKRSHKNLKTFVQHAEEILVRAVEKTKEKILLEDIHEYFGEHPKKEDVKAEKKDDVKVVEPKPAEKEVKKEPPVEKPKEPVKEVVHETKKVEEKIVEKPKKKETHDKPKEPSTIAERYY